MNHQLSYPKVLLVGRTNVGKSTLFNRLAQQKISIVFEYEGVTRDYVQELINWEDKSFLLIDTGGLTFERHPDEIGKQVQESVLTLLLQADLILFVVDSKHGLVEKDLRIANVLRKTKKPLFLVMNKADNQHALENNLPDFYKLGLQPMIPVSGIHGTGIADLLHAVAQAVPEPQATTAPTPSYKVVIIGRPNVGKSSLMNLLIQYERSIVANIAGTTREAISAMTYHCNDLIQVTDTAGVRRSRNISDELEHLMVKSSLQAIKEADIVLIMIDASEGKIADQELKLLFHAYEHRKMVIAVFNKIDLLDDYKRATLEQSTQEYQFILKKIPQIWISCLTHKNVGRIFDEVQHVWRRCGQTFDDVQLDSIVKKDLEKIHLYHTKQQLKVDKITSIKNARTPAFALEVNYPEWFGPTELGCIENIIRNHYDLLGCPISFTVKEGK